MDAFAVLPDNERSGQSQGAASLGVLTLALLTAASGDIEAALNLGRAAGALRPPLDVDQPAFAALLTELSGFDPDALIRARVLRRYQGLYSSLTCYADVAGGSFAPPNLSG